MTAALVIIPLATAGLAAEVAAYVLARIADRRASSAPMYQDPTRAETDAWDNAYPERTDS